MSPESIIAIIGVAIIIISIGILIFKRLPRRLKLSKYRKKWRELQKLCAKKDTWPNAIDSADTLLNYVLKQKRISGKTMGERLVSARERFTDNDSVWRAHKYAEHIRNSGGTELVENDVKQALVAFRQALKDLKAL